MFVDIDQTPTRQEKMVHRCLISLAFVTYKNSEYPNLVSKPIICRRRPDTYKTIDTIQSQTSVLK